MKIKWFALSVLSLSLGAAYFATGTAHGTPLPSPAAGYGQDRGGWDAPPAEFREAQRQGFHDGIEGARKDFDNHRRPDVNNRDEYRHPRVARDLREDYREGFRQGYDRAMHHLMGEPGR
ncbi:MAG: hypothetical protein ABSE87_09950 [Terracidiphilus sp.]|jgi:hypothetical protein